MKKNYSLLFLLLPLFMFSQTTDLIISKYGEGSSNHKFLEIYNGTGSDIDLSTYAFPNSNNAPDTVGEYDYWNSFTAGAVIAAGDVYVLTDEDADASLLAVQDQEHNYLSNGDDGFKLVKDFTWNDADNDGNIDQGEMTGFTVVDVLGDWQADPGSGWAVAGVSNGTKEHTLTRKTSVCSGNTDWASSAGTTTEDSEWVVTGQNEGWDTVGSYTTACVSSTTESIPWSSDLEGDLSEFTTYQASSGSGMWAITTARYNSGAQSVYHNDTSGSHDSWLLTPTFDLSGATAPELKYWDNENYASYYDNHEVLVSEDYTDDVAAATWVELADGVSDEDTWVERGPLALPTTGTVTVAFRYVGNYADEWYLDDISVAEAPTAASADWDVSAANFSDSATVSVTVDNFTVTTDGSGDGHWHYTLDGGSAVMVYDTNDVTLTSLSTGDHTLVAWLVDNAHADLDPAVTETITWTQTNAPGCGDDPYDHYYGNGSSGGYSFATNFTAPDAAELLFTTSVDNAGDTMTIVLSGYTEENYDWVYITDGAGNVLLTPVSGDLNDTVTATDGTINVYLASDSSVTVGPTTFTITCETPITYESIPWYSDLEGDLSEFTTYQASSGTGMWAITTSRYRSGAQSVYHNDASGDHDSWLLTPTFDLSAATAPELKYWDNENYASYYVNHEVLVSEDYTDDVAAATWTVLATGVSEEDTWVERGPLALPTTGTVTVAFRYVGDYADAWYLDDITVAEDTWSVDDVDPLDMRIYPNPVDGNFVTILSPVNGTKYIQVFDINGRRVMDTSINNNTLDVSSINSGFYMIKVTIDGQSKISKLVVR